MRSAKLKRFVSDFAHKAAMQRGLRAGFELGGWDRRIVAAYLRTEGAKRLHIGCGDHPLSGWLNSNYPVTRGIFSVRQRIISLDATQEFPFPNDAFDSIKSEHVIEHVPYRAGVGMVRECFRILRPGGRIRISTPDLDFLVTLLREPLDGRRRDYIAWAAKAYLHPDERPSPAAIVNNFMRDWGHEFIYDRKSLVELLEASGFVDIVPREINQSDDPALAGTDYTERMPEGFLDLETMTYEARKPA